MCDVESCSRAPDRDGTMWSHHGRYAPRRGANPNDNIHHLDRLRMRWLGERDVGTGVRKEPGYQRLKFGKGKALSVERSWREIRC